MSVDQSIRKSSANSFFDKMFTASEKLSIDDMKSITIRKDRKMQGTFVGTRDYLAPEMVDDASISGPFTDLWALGIIIFELYTGHTPWTDDKNLMIIDDIEN